MPTIRPRNPVTPDTLLVEPKLLQKTYCNRVRHAQCPLNVLFHCVLTVGGRLSRRFVKVRNFLFNDAVSYYKRTNIAGMILTEVKPQYSVENVYE
jgi:hypothetical protein